MHCSTSTWLKIEVVSFYGFMNSDCKQALPSAPFQSFVGSAWDYPDQCQHQSSPGVSQVNCAAHIAWHGGKKHHSKLTHEGKIKLGLPPYAPKLSSLPAAGWSIFAVWDRRALWELWEEQWAWHGKGTYEAAAFVLPEEEPKFSCFRFFCRSWKPLTP